MIKKLRIKWNEFKDAYMDLGDESVKVYTKVNILFIGFISFIIYIIGLIFILNYDCQTVGNIFIGIAFLYLIISTLHFEIFLFHLGISSKILNNIFGKYGRVITKKDWDMIKKVYPKAYRYLTSNKCMGDCYECSYRIALLLDDAKLMYCSKLTAGGTFSGHSVILKGNYVYDTNHRRHFTLDEFKQNFESTIYKIFSFEEYSKDDFFSSIAEDFVSWCNENNFYVDFD